MGHSIRELGQSDVALGQAVDVVGRQRDLNLNRKDMGAGSLWIGEYMLTLLYTLNHSG